MKKTVDAWRRVLDRLRTSWKPVLLTHLAFTAIRFSLFMPLIGITGKLLLRLSGETVLADQDIALFLLSPGGMFALALFSSLLITILVFEQAAIMSIARATMQGKSLNTVGALQQGLRKLRALWLLAIRLVIRILLISLPPLLAAALVAWVLLAEYDINYYLTEKPAEFIWAVGIIGILLLATALLLGRKLIQWSLCLPLVLLSDCSAADSFAASTRLLDREHKQALLILLSWAAISLLLGIVALGAIRLLGNAAIPPVSGSLYLTLLVTGALLALLALVNLLLSAFTSGSFAFLIMDLYSRLGNRDLLEKDAVSATGAAAQSWVLTRSKLIVLIVGGLVVAGSAGLWLLNSIPTNNEVIIAAHRGAAGKAPENTLAAVRQAIEDQADWIEIDVQENDDGEVVVIHDSDFMKLAKNPLKIWEASTSQLQEIDVGSWFDSSFSAERVPRLAQVLDQVRGHAGLLIELKYYGHDDMLEQRVVDIVEQADMADDVAIMSLKYAGIARVRSLRPEWPTGLLSATAVGDLSTVDADFLAVSMGMVSAGLVERAHRAGKKLFVWTVNDPVSLSKMVSMDVDGIITDEPEMARSVLAQRAEMTTVQRLLTHLALLFGNPAPNKTYRDDSP